MSYIPAKGEVLHEGYVYTVSPRDFTWFLHRHRHGTDKLSSLFRGSYNYKEFPADMDETLVIRKILKL